MREQATSVDGFLRLNRIWVSESYMRISRFALSLSRNKVFSCINYVGSQD